MQAKYKNQIVEVWEIGKDFAGYSMYVLGYPGDYLDLTNHKVVSAATFHRDYQVL